MAPNSDTLAACHPTPPNPNRETGTRAIDARMVHLVMACSDLLWSEAAAILGIPAANIEGEDIS